MKLSALVIATLSLAFVALPSFLNEALLPDTEPPLRLEVELDGVKYETEAGKETEVAVSGKKVAMTVRVKPTRRFAAAGITFEFPSGMIYVFESEEGLDMWTLNGDSCLIMVQQLDAGNAAELAEIVLDEILTDSAGKATKPRSVELQLGKKKVAARRGLVEGGDFDESWTACGVDVKGRPVILLLQELLEEDGSSTGEMQIIRDHLARTFARVQ